MRVSTPESRPIVKRPVAAGNWLGGLTELFREHGDVAPMRSSMAAGSRRSRTWGRPTYTRMVIAESMRLYPPAWIQGREAIESCEVNGRRIERGTNVFLPQWIVHRDPRWWPEPLKFDPTHFGDEAAKARPKWAYFPFGGGSRACVGEAFAWAEAVLVLATVARRWRLESVDAGEPELEPGITLRPKGEVRMVVRGRRT